jgi:hypothetical protein
VVLDHFADVGSSFFFGHGELGVGILAVRVLKVNPQIMGRKCGAFTNQKSG